MPEEKTDSKPLDWGKIHDFVVEKGNAFLETFDKADVDWFLRDSNVAGPGLTSMKESELVSSAVSAKDPSTKPITTPSPALLPVSNTNENSAAKTKPTVLEVLDEQIHSEKYHDFARRSLTRRRSSVSSMVSVNSASSNGSGGGFFSKLKNKLHRSDSVSQSSAPKLGSPVAESPLLFKDDYKMGPAHKDHVTEPGPKSGPAPKASQVEPERKQYLSELQYLDPRLEDYIRFYRRQSLGLRRPSLKSENSTMFPNGCLVNHEQLSSGTQPQGKISSLFRHMSIGSGPMESLGHKNSLDSRSTMLLEGSGEIKLPKPLKRVCFHSLTFLMDPPQQIPSRNPRKGNVEVLPSGAVRIRPLTEAEKIAIEKSQRGLGGGLVVGGTGALGLVKKEELEEIHEKLPEEEKPDSEQKLPDDEEDTAIDKHAESLGIEKPMYHHVAKPGYTVPVKKMALDLMYTRCCHLREILPIPAIAKQIPKGSMAPLPILQLRNPNPTMIEIQTFADFIRIAPIICISLDGVNLSYEQFKELLSAMSAKKQLEKLSLRNTPISCEGWSLLCLFLSRNTVLNRLDITQCPPLSVNVLKRKKKKQEEQAIERMTCNKENRSDMDWAQFTATLIARGGIEELILTGCCITDFVTFENLISKAVCLKTYKLGLAYNQLTPQQLKVVLDHWALTDFSRGLDLGYNDFLSLAHMNVFLEVSKSPKFLLILPHMKLAFLSLNATNIRFSQIFRDTFENLCMKLTNLKYLDLSNNPKLFGRSHNKTPSSSGSVNSSLASPNSKQSGSTGSTSDDSLTKISQEQVVSYFCSKLPLIPKLMRLHLENNHLSSSSLTVLFETLPFCTSLAYISVLGNTLDIASATALIQGLKNSRTLITVDGDFSQLPEVLKEKIGLYTMRNMENFFQLSVQNNGLDDSCLEHKPHELTLTEELNNILLRKAEEKLSIKSPEVVHFIERAQRDRKKLKSTINDLFHLQWKNELGIEGKEALIRLLFIDSSLERGLKLIDPDLVAKEESFTSSDILNINLAEDERNELKLSALSKVQDASAVHENSFKPVESGSLPVSRTQSLTNLNNLNREEGSVLKLLQMDDKDESVFNNLSVYSGEEIRKKLNDINLSELDNIVDYLSKARKKGISFKDLFSSTDESGETHKDMLDEIRQKIHILRELHLGKKDDVADAAVDSDLEKDSDDPEAGGEQTAIEEAYDKMLSRFTSSLEP